MHIRTAGVQIMRDNPERFIGSNTENSWLRYLNNMCIQGTWADALIIQAVADILLFTQFRKEISLVPRPVRAIRVARGGLEPSAIARGVLGEFSRQA